LSFAIRTSKVAFFDEFCKREEELYLLMLPKCGCVSLVLLEVFFTRAIKKINRINSLTWPEKKPLWKDGLVNFIFQSFFISLRNKRIFESGLIDELKVNSKALINTPQSFSSMFCLFEKIYFRLKFLRQKTLY